MDETLGKAGKPIGDVGQIIHGTTLVTNALIERKGAPTALLASEGHRDSLEIGREHRYDLYDLQLEMPRPLVPRYLRFGVPGRTLAPIVPVRPPVASLQRGNSRGHHYYCADHMYGRWIEADRVMWWRQRPVAA